MRKSGQGGGTSGTSVVSSYCCSLMEYFFFFLKAIFTSFSVGSQFTLTIYTFGGLSYVLGSLFSSNT